MEEKVTKKEPKKKTENAREFVNIELDPALYPKEELKLGPGLLEIPKHTKRLTVRKKKCLNPIPMFALKDIALGGTLSGLLITNGYLPTAAVHTDIVLYFSLAFTIAAVLFGKDIVTKNLAER